MWKFTHTHIYTYIYIYINIQTVKHAQTSVLEDDGTNCSLRWSDFTQGSEILAGWNHMIINVYIYIYNFMHTCLYTICKPTSLKWKILCITWGQKSIHNDNVDSTTIIHKTPWHPATSTLQPSLELSRAIWHLFVLLVPGIKGLPGIVLVLKDTQQVAIAKGINGLL